MSCLNLQYDPEWTGQGQLSNFCFVAGYRSRCPVGIAVISQYILSKLTFYRFSQTFLFEFECILVRRGLVSYLPTSKRLLKGMQRMGKLEKRDTGTSISPFSVPKSNVAVLRIPADIRNLIDSALVTVHRRRTAFCFSREKTPRVMRTRRSATHDRTSFFAPQTVTICSWRLSIMGDYSTKNEC